jgi:hypothetical protein
VQNNLFEDINSAAWGSTGKFFNMGGILPSLVVNHNTAINNGTMFTCGDISAAGKMTEFEYTDNIAHRGSYGFICSDRGEGTGSLNTYHPGYQFTKNAIATATLSQYPAGNFSPASYAAVGFMNFAGGDFRLGASSTLRNAGTDGKDVGANINAIAAAVGCTIGGQCGGPTPPQGLVTPFTFTNSNQTVTPGTLVVSNVITVSGPNLTLPVNVSVSGGGSYSIGCNTTVTRNTGLVNPGETVCVRYNAPATQNTRTAVVLTIGNVSQEFVSFTSPVMDPLGDNDSDGIPNGVEGPVGRNIAIKDNDIFNNPRLFPMQQYRDYLGREGDSLGIDFYMFQLLASSITRAQVVDVFLRSPEFQNTVGVATRLYFSFFRRLPDYAGLTFQAQQLRNGVPVQEVAQAFASSPEFTTTYGALTNAQYVDLVYQNVLGRAPDPAGQAFYLDGLNNGTMTRGSVMVGFSESPEFTNMVANDVFVVALYVGTLRRTPIQSEVDFYTNILETGGTRTAVIEGFIGAPEYRARFLP